MLNVAGLGTSALSYFLFYSTSFGCFGIMNQRKKYVESCSQTTEILEYKTISENLPASTYTYSTYTYSNLLWAVKPGKSRARAG